MKVISQSYVLTNPSAPYKVGYTEIFDIS